jgi:hypothetical protein
MTNTRTKPDLNPEPVTDDGTAPNLGDPTPEGGNHTPYDAKTDSYDAKTDSGIEPADDSDAVYLVVAKHRDGRTTTEFHTGETVGSYVSTLTWGSKQHRQECEREDRELPEGGGAYEINRKDVRVLKLAATEVTNL